MRNMKCKIISATTTGATGLVTKGLKENLEPYQETIERIHHKCSYTRNVTRYIESTAV
jgi:hypothetical protein